MSTQRQELATTHFSFAPTSLKEAIEYATIFANSGLCPAAYKGRPNDILIVWQMGRELGLDKMQSLRTLSCINGVPFAFGDGALALIKRHRDFEDMSEGFEGDFNTQTLTAVCTIKRRGQKPVTQKFSIEDAKRAGLWGSKDNWLKYPKRMLQHRARTYAGRDAFPDALFGLSTQEEVLSMTPAEVTPTVKTVHKGMQGLEESLGIKEPENQDDPIIEGEVIGEPTEILNGLDELKELISFHAVKERSVKAYLKRYGVESIENLNEEQISKWSNHLKTKEKANDPS